MMHAAGGGAALLLFVWAVAATAKAKARAARLARTEAELAELKTAPRDQEYRMERYDVLWFPVVTYKPLEKALTAVQAGSPHCPKCVKPLKAGPGENWQCPGCGIQRPSSVVDVVVTDQIAGQAALWFLERHPDHTDPKALSRKGRS